MIFRYQHMDKVYEINLERQGDSYQAVIDDQVYLLRILEDQPGQLTLLFQGRPVRIYWANSNDQKWFSVEGCTYTLKKPVPPSARTRSDHKAAGKVHAQIPAVVQEILVEQGQHVEKGQALMILVAMKMEIRLAAPVSGTVIQLNAQAGQTVARDQLLVEIS